METYGIDVAGHRGLRGQILVAVKKSQPITTKQLSSAFGVSANAIRRHLKELELDGLVSYGREQRGLGAPTFAYRLTERGEALFPNRYQDALTELLAHVEERAGRGEVSAIFAERFRAQAEQLKTELADLPVEARLQRLVRLLSDEGYMAEWKAENGFITLAEHNCAIRAVAQRYPEICAAEARFLTDVLSAGVERRDHITAGSNACTYAITALEPSPRAGAKASGDEA
jgi:DeoR family suf operon transcriptional repressor